MGQQEAEGKQRGSPRQGWGCRDVLLEEFVATICADAQRMLHVHLSGQVFPVARQCSILIDWAPGASVMGPRRQGGFLRPRPHLRGWD